MWKNIAFPLLLQLLLKNGTKVFQLLWKNVTRALIKKIFQFTAMHKLKKERIDE